MPKRGVLSAVAWFSSLGVVWRYGSAPGIAAYTLASISLAWVLERVRIAKSLQFSMVVIAGVFTVVALIIIYPHANVHQPNAGSDADDALNLAARALVHWRYLYGTK